MAREEITELEQVVFETAGEHVATRVPVATPGERVGDVRRSLDRGADDSTPWPPSPCRTAAGS